MPNIPQNVFMRDLPPFIDAAQKTPTKTDPQIELGVLKESFDHIAESFDHIAMALPDIIARMKVTSEGINRAITDIKNGMPAMAEGRLVELLKNTRKQIDLLSQLLR